MLIDITQEVFSGKVYPGDTPPRRKLVSSLEEGAACSVTDFSMCAHNGTHADAPSHYVRGGKGADLLDLNKCVGLCEVRTFSGPISKAELRSLRAPRLLVKGGNLFTAEEAALLCECCVLVGTENQTVGDGRVHRILLEREVVVLEGLSLVGAEDGLYELYALPMKLGGADGAPVRAVLKTLGAAGEEAARAGKEETR